MIQRTAPSLLRAAASLRRTAPSLLLAAVAVALTLTIAQGPFDESSFAFQQYRGYSGTIFTTPAPTLATAGGTYLLTRPGKFDANVHPWHGRPVTLRGALIQSGPNRMLEIEPGSIRATNTAPQSPPPIEHLRTIELTGEIADGKCYYGVMNPGRGKVHRDCAVRCLSGGAPPVFLVRDASGSLHALLLTGLGHEILNHVAEPIRLRGELQRTGSQLVFKAVPSSLATTVISSNLATASNPSGLATTVISSILTTAPVPRTLATAAIPRLPATASPLPRE